MISWRMVVMVSALAGGGVRLACAQGSIEQLQPLVETSAQRLVLAEQVALAKWDSGAGVEDLPREEQVIAGAILAGKSRGLAETAVANFFKAQIEASKEVQYSLLADWRRAGRVPAHAPVDLAGKIRPELDRIQTALIGELADTAAVRASATCLDDVARAAGRYLATHRQQMRPSMALALDRSLAAACPAH